MSNPRPLPERIDLTRADDPRDVVHRAVACLAQGGVVALPTESAYRLVASALRTDAVERLRRLGGRELPHALTLGLKGNEEVADWVPWVSTVGRRLARRAWPGPVVLVFTGDVACGLARRLPADVRSAVAPGTDLGLSSPGNAVVREILGLIPGPLILAGAGLDESDAATTPDAIADLADLDMILDDGPIRPVRPSTVVRVDQDDWEIVRPGAVDAHALRRMAGTIVLFVCTGNTCRSPMAEALCKALLADRLGCEVDQLEAKGFVILSAGLGATNGMPAAANAIEVVRARGGSLKDHSSRRVTPDLVDHADWIVAMTRDHQDALLHHVPEAAPRTRLLHPLGDDVDDPVGADRETYRRTADDIASHLVHLVGELGL